MINQNNLEKLVDAYSMLENVSLDAFNDFQRRHRLFHRFHCRMKHRLPTKYSTGHDFADFRSWQFRQLDRNYSTGKLIEQFLLENKIVRYNLRPHECIIVLNSFNIFFTTMYKIKKIAKKRREKI